MISAKLNVVNNMEIQRNGITALKDALGVTGALKFLEQFDRGGYGDYTAEKYQNEESEPTDEEIRRMFGQ
ncbi:MAG: hypothetical protein OSJ59_16165 [Lachnospiraceae bacterium]|nr:hypothetical protein [Lachnospiraceae bacterium]